MARKDLGLGLGTGAGLGLGWLSSSGGGGGAGSEAGSYPGGPMLVPKLDQNQGQVKAVVTVMVKEEDMAAVMATEPV
ncbi:hypothetical protein SLEP1_g32177 [Rubroshorea leprosula]|uniref:Uncharacterized protein n=1 Tax=Rubroshorea leprosula TaxID=152421 RepID=A0AAV5KCR3_9ROSI|nr:hypothetical protein SLEP1_g32177 [Rubroshorea leprosula]